MLYDTFGIGPDPILILQSSRVTIYFSFYFLGMKAASSFTRAIYNSFIAPILSTYSILDFLSSCKLKLLFTQLFKEFLNYLFLLHFFNSLQTQSQKFSLFTLNQQTLLFQPVQQQRINYKVKHNLNIFQKVMSAQFNAQLDKLLEREKVARINNEHFNSVAILKDIITLCYKAQNWDKLFEMINFLMNRRGQGKKAQIEMIQLAMTWIHDTPEPHRTRLIETIRDVTAKKIFLQVEYARCILMIVKGKQNDNDIFEAAKILQEVQVETYGSMDRREKLEFILYQMKIMIKKEDYVRLFIISKKINENNLGDDEIADIKIAYYSYMAIYYNSMNNYLEASKCYRTIWKTLKTTKKMLPQRLDFNFSIDIHNVLSNYVGFLVLHPYCAQTEAELQSLRNDEQLQKNQAVYHLITNFLSEQIVPTDINTYHLDEFQLFRESYKNSEKHKAELKRMLTQHNIRIISKYYSQLTLQRMSDLINVQKDYCEEELCHLNNDKVISCRVDRINDIIDFKPVEHQTNLLQKWNESINQILDMVDITSNLINREKEIYGK